MSYRAAASKIFDDASNEYDSAGVAEARHFAMLHIDGIDQYVLKHSIMAIKRISCVSHSEA